MDTRGTSLAVNRPGHEADHSPSSSAEVRNMWSCTFSLPTYLHGMCSVKAQGQLYFYYTYFTDRTKHYYVTVKG